MQGCFGCKGKLHWVFWRERHKCTRLFWRQRHKYADLFWLQGTDTQGSFGSKSTSTQDRRLTGELAHWQNSASQLHHLCRLGTCWVQACLVSAGCPSGESPECRPSLTETLSCRPLLCHQNSTTCIGDQTQ
jgi:hypothetical protein